MRESRTLRAAVFLFPDPAQERPASPVARTVSAAAALGAALGIGRFVYTPILPLMHAQAGLSAPAGAGLATANYIGYLIGALASIAVPVLVGSRWALRASLGVLVVTLGLMPSTQVLALWWVLRLVAGAASALVFVIAVHALLNGPGRARASSAEWGFGGIGAGIAVSGVAVLAVRTVGDWRTTWWLAAALTLVLAIVSWPLRPEPAHPAPARDPGQPRRGPVTRPFAALFASYTLEGVGYIIAGTFLVAAIDQSSPGWVGTAAWVLAGLAAIPAALAWSGLARRFSRPTLLTAGLVLQAAGIALPALTGQVAAALISAAIFGATFLNISQLAMAAGNHLRVPHAVAVLTTGYSAGQILGPLAVAPLLRDGYRVPLLLAAAVVLAAALGAGVLCATWPGRGQGSSARR